MEPFTSRIPGVLPSYNKDGKLYTFTSEAVMSRQYEKPHNYGMFPMSVNLKSFLETDSKLKIVDDGITINGEGDCIVSYRRLDDWFFFFHEYYDLLNNHGTCGNAYGSAVEYYDKESKSKYSTKLKYGNDRKKYEDIDSFFNNHCGKVVMRENSKNLNYGTEDLNISLVATDGGLYKFIRDNYFIQFVIPFELRDAWGCKALWYGDTIRWVNWFSIRYKQYSKLKNTDCPNTKDCCDCEEYFKRGGNDMYKRLKEWVEKTSNKAKELEDAFNADDRLKPTIIYSFDIHESIEDMGEMSIFSKEWEESVDYFNTLDKTKYGTVVLYNGKPYIIKKESEILGSKQNIKNIENNRQPSLGFKFDEKYLERVWGNDTVNVWNNGYEIDNSEHWKDYTDFYIETHNDDFSFKHTYYTHDFNGNIKRIYGENKIDVDTLARNLNTEHVYFAKKDIFVINGLMYPIEKVRYIIYNNNLDKYLNGRLFIVNKYKDTNTEYININGVTIYEKGGLINGNVIKDGLVVNYNDEYLLVENNMLTVQDSSINYHYPKIDGYISYGDDDFYILNNKLVNVGYSYTLNSDSSFTQEVKDITDDVKKFYGFENIIFDDNEVKFIHKYNIEDTDYITGVTDSKLVDLLPPIRYYDDIGNEMHGYSTIPSTTWGGVDTVDDDNGNNPLYSQPMEGSLLSPYYNIGNVSNLSVLKGGNYKGDSIFYNGNILISMKFYLTDEDGNKLTNFHESEKSLNAIEEVYTEYNGDINNTHLKCDIIYNINATLQKSGSKYFIPKGYSSGVTFNETVEFVKKQEKYNTSTNDSIIVFYYDIVHEKDVVTSTLYGTDNVNNRVTFKMPITRLGEGGIAIDMDKNINTVTTPLFRENYKLGISSMQSVRSNIYIDRGISYAFDKHIKLGEVSTLEALENYSNGYLNIIES